MRAWVVVSALLLATTSASSALFLLQSAATEAHAIDPPLVLSEGGQGATVLGASRTSAEVTYTAAGLTRTNVTQIHGSAQDWTVRMNLDSSNGIGAMDNYTIALCDNSTCSDQVVVSDGAVTQSTGTLFTVPAGSRDVHVAVSDVKQSTGDTVFVTSLIVLGPGGAAPDVRYAYTLTVTT